MLGLGLDLQDLNSPLAHLSRLLEERPRVDLICIIPLSASCQSGLLYLGFETRSVYWRKEDQLSANTVQPDFCRNPRPWKQSIHFLLNKLQPAIYSHHSLVFLLLQQDRPDDLVDVGFLIQAGEFAVYALVFLLLRLKLLAGFN